MTRVRDALSEFLEALARPQNYDLAWDPEKGELHVRPLAERPARRARRPRRRKGEPASVHPLA